MASQTPVANAQLQNKRKQAPHSLRTPPNKRAMLQKNARTIVTQTSDKALKNGELDLQAFIKAREFEIKALEDGMRKSKNALTTRAFQQVPRDMRRRTASHNAKRVPKRLQTRAKKEMKEDKTPINKKKPGSTRARLRAETAKKLGFLSERKRATRTALRENAQSGMTESIVTRPPRPKVKKNQLSEAPKPRSKFRKRQIHKTWLPTHIYHTKRARMTEPKDPLWRFAIPLTPSMKSYRPTHRQGGARGAICWDMSYMSTIGLNGSTKSLEKVLKSIGLANEELWGKRGLKWRSGKRSWSGYLVLDRTDGQISPVAPATVLWSPEKETVSPGEDNTQKENPTSSTRKVLIRVHPSAFLEIWDELICVSKMQRPLVVHVEDLRFEIGSIEITGPGSTETLLGILHPFEKDSDGRSHAENFLALAGVTNPASLPPNALLSFSVSDPRLHYPPRQIKVPNPADEGANYKLLEVLSTWPIDSCTGSPSFFDRESRYKATRLPSQKSIHRRKGLASPGAYPSPVSTDPEIPIILLASRAPTLSSGSQGSWTLLAPWKCILPFWYGFMHYPLTSGGNPSFGGLEEHRQLNLERGVPWFPGDFPGTKAGWAWEEEQRKKRKDAWDRRPKGKRVAWDKIDLGNGQKGEIGIGWSCDFERLAGKDKLPEATDSNRLNLDVDSSNAKNLPPLPQLSTSSFTSLLKAGSSPRPPNSLVKIRVSLFTGVPQPCARIYRLPRPLLPTIASTDSTCSSTRKPTLSLRQQWLSLLPESFADIKSKPPSLKRHTQSQTRLPDPQNMVEYKKAIAQSLLRGPALPFPAPETDPSERYPAAPGEEDLIGFVTTGNFNLADGKGVGIGSVMLDKILESWNLEVDGKRIKEKERKLCIVRNSGTNTGRLAIWEAA